MLCIHFIAEREKRFLHPMMFTGGSQRCMVSSSFSIEKKRICIVSWTYCWNGDIFQRKALTRNASLEHSVSFKSAAKFLK